MLSQRITEHSTIITPTVFHWKHTDKSEALSFVLLSQRITEHSYDCHVNCFSLETHRTLSPQLFCRTLNCHLIKITKAKHERGEKRQELTGTAIKGRPLLCEHHYRFQILILPGQSLTLQFRICWLGPEQDRPPPFGIGLEHVRVLFWSPLPQLLEQADHPFQAPQLPSTTITSSEKLLTNFSKLFF